MKMMNVDAKTYRTPEDDYSRKTTEKIGVCLHHTGGASVNGAVSHLHRKRDYVSVPYFIDKIGNIFNTYDCLYQSYHLGVEHRKLGLPSGYYDFRFIGIEIVNEGALKPTPSDPTYLGLGWNPEIKVCRLADTHMYLKTNKPWRGYSYFMNYTQQQVDSAAWLSSYLTLSLKLPERVCSEKARTSEKADFKEADRGGILTHVVFRDGAQKTDLSLSWNWSMFETLYFQYLDGFKRYIMTTVTR